MRALGGLRDRLSRDPYFRLARHRPFALFWTGQTVSLFGDRLNQVALAVLIYATTNSSLMTALVFVAATLPNIIIGPLGGVAADRFDRRKLMIITDLVRAALVLSVPFLVAISPWLALINVFLVTCASLIFRPAKTAVIPDIAPDGELQAASGATWLSDSLADLIGYPAAGLIVGVLGTNMIAAVFVLDAATYIASALLILPLPIKAVVAAQTIAGQGAVRRVQVDLIEGWRFLRHTPSLFENTLISMVAQLAVGINIALLVIYARTALVGGDTLYPAYYAVLNTATGAGAIIGSLVAGRLSRRHRGTIILLGFAGMGLGDIALGLSDNIVLASVVAVVGAVANLIWLVPTQALFLEQTPGPLLGRVAALRGTFVFGSITAAMATAGLIATVVPAALVIAGGGVITLTAALLGFTRPALRHPEAFEFADAPDPVTV